MKICFITPNSHVGTVPRKFDNLRTEFAWQVALDAVHYPIDDLVSEKTNAADNYDLGIIILPKKLEIVNTEKLLHLAKYMCKKLTVMQEGPAWYFQDYDYTNQVNYLNFLGEMDFLLVHNNSDIPYFKGIFKKPTFTLPSLMIEDGIKDIVRQDAGNTIIGGNFCSWYSGIDSYFVAQTFQKPIYAPSMGRKISNENNFTGLTHLPFMWWKNWMVWLSKFHMGIHLMRTHAAGTFALNCAYFGIPCIGYVGLDTQQTLFPDLSVPIGDIEWAINLATRLKNDDEFYNYVSLKALDLYQIYYTEEVFKKHWAKIYDGIKN